MRIVYSMVLVFLWGCTQTSDNGVQKTAVSVTDFQGRQVTLGAAAQRIVALAPHIVENVFSAHAGDKLVGVIEHSNYPNAAKSIERVGSYAKINIEKIVRLDPDLVIAWETGNIDPAIKRLMELGYPVYIDQPDSLHDVAKSVIDIGILSGREKPARAAAQAYLAELEETEQRYRDAIKISVFYQVWDQPLQTISGHHIISHAIEICGGKNIFADEFAVAPIVGIETILDKNPQMILASGISDERPDWLDDWQKWPSLSAVKNQYLFHVPPDYIQRHSFRLLSGLSIICAQLDQVRAIR